MDVKDTASNRSRQNSAAPMPMLAQDVKSANVKSSKTDTATTPLHHTVFIRLPFPRTSFTDPSPIAWNADKDKALWKLISTASNSQELDWAAMGERFGVGLDFLLMQAAWLYERHFEGMRAGMRRLGGAGGAVEKGGVDGSGKAGVEGGVGMQRQGSKDSSRATPSINTIKNSSLPQADSGSTPSTPRSYKPAFSRTPSTATVTQSRISTNSRQGFRASPNPSAKQAPTDGVSEGESESEDDAPSAANISRSQAFARPAFNKKSTTGTLSSDADGEDDDDDSSGGNLPFAAPSKPTNADPAATLKSSPKRPGTLAHSTASKANSPQPQPQSSSASSPSTSSTHPTQPRATAPSQPTDLDSRPPGAISPKHRAALSNLSPRYKRSANEDSGPSMGSSFSDLDDASVTQSALEDALMSNLRDGQGSIGMGSRISTLRDALGRK